MRRLRSHHPLRSVFRSSLQMAALAWAWRNRNGIRRRFFEMRGRMSGSPTVQGSGAMATLDASRPPGDRYVPPSADRPANAYESAMADAHRISDPDISQQYVEASSHVRIDVDESQERR